MRILLVEDSRLIGEAVKDHIATTPHAVDWVLRLEDADAAVGSVDYGLILLDLQLPDGDGISFLKRIRRNRMTVPVIILTARDQVTDRIEGLNAGADDYLVKPFDLGELEARVAAVSRRYDGRPQPILQFGDMEVDRPHHALTVAGDTVLLTRREWAVLDLLVARPGIIVPKGQIEEALYEFGAEIESNTVEVYVSRLRKKVGKERIRTIRGIGYLLEEK
ncbi:MAG: DNA-binding response regulator [Rhizobiales bacterium 63-7]|mgnify:CR=1 FL=1|uniref:response regulator n=1 Tax=Rhizobium sp. YJ-22 TaxID=3037556 RepID=UPI000926AB75|nr:response regulator [Rhizobium sp. YJ-22]MBN9034196.1 response regulator [Hyphomicrobiales bacterium]MDG3580306.1 response regulator [Rhizobium sp. YJ-22]OJU66439.1 MAG: DNA-binding response regulator [Rhizobiales bacterium 63-7]